MAHDWERTFLFALPEPDAETRALAEMAERLDRAGRDTLDSLIREATGGDRGADDFRARVYVSLGGNY